MTDNKDMTAGQMLTDARMNGRRKREIATIAKLLCIREEYLTALEQGEYDKIPEMVYVLGFARNYAMELGLDPDEVIAKIKSETGAPDDKDDDDDEPESSVAVVAAAPAKVGFVKKYWKWALGGIALVVLIVLGIILIANMGGGADVPADNGDAPAVVETAVAPAYTVSVRERFGTENADGAKIIIQATKESWVKIEDARNNTEFSRVLVAGDVYYAPSGAGYRATFGNAGGVDVWVNGALAPAVGAMNERKTIDMDGLVSNQ